MIAKMSIAQSGLEIHQQLLTSKKLFCRCPAGLYSASFYADIIDSLIDNGYKGIIIAGTGLGLVN